MKTMKIYFCPHIDLKSEKRGSSCSKTAACKQGKPTTQIGALHLCEERKL